MAASPETKPRFFGIHAAWITVAWSRFAAREWRPVLAWRPLLERHPLPDWRSLLQWHPLMVGVRRLWQVVDRENIPRVVGMGATIMLMGGLLVLLAERFGEDPLITSPGEAFWYAIVTMTGTGYGDYTPKTGFGRFLGAGLMLGGMTTLSFVTATVASMLVAQKIKEGRGLEAVKFKDHLLICGWNPNGERVLDGLAVSLKRPQVVLVNDLPEERASEILARSVGIEGRFVKGDPSIEAVLERAAARLATAAIVLADTSGASMTASDERTALVALTLKSLSKSIKITAEAMNLDSETHLKRAGADDIVISGEFNSFLLSTSATAPGISKVVRQVLTMSGRELQRAPIPPDLVGKTFREATAAMRLATGFLTVAIVTEQKGLALDDLLTDDYSLVDRFIKDQFSVAGAEHLRFEGGAIQVKVNPPDDYVITMSDTAIGIAAAND